MVRIAAARDRLQAHHSAQRPMAPQPRYKWMTDKAGKRVQVIDNGGDGQSRSAKGGGKGTSGERRPFVPHSQRPGAWPCPVPECAKNLGRKQYMGPADMVCTECHAPKASAPAMKQDSYARRAFVLLKRAPKCSQKRRMEWNCGAG